MATNITATAPAQRSMTFNIRVVFIFLPAFLVMAAMETAFVLDVANPLISNFLASHGIDPGQGIFDSGANSTHSQCGHSRNAECLF